MKNTITFLRKGVDFFGIMLYNMNKVGKYDLCDYSVLQRGKLVVSNYQMQTNYQSI